MAKLRRNTVSWWANKLDIPVSTIYAAIQKGHLQAVKPGGACYRISKDAVKMWLEMKPVEFSQPELFRFQSKVFSNWAKKGR